VDDRRRTVELGIRTRTIWKVGLNVVAFLALLHVLTNLGPVVAWLLIALVLALALDPPVTWLARQKVQRWLAVLGSFGVLLGAISAVVVTFAPVLVDQTRSLVARVPELLERLKQSSMLASLNERFDLVDKASEHIATGTQVAFASVVAVAGGIAFGLVSTVTIVALTIFMLIFGRQLVRRGLDWIPPDRRQKVRDLGRGMHKAVGGYVLGSLVIAAIGGVVTGITLAILGVPYFLPLALLMAFLGIIPFIGPTIGGITVVGATFLASGSRAGIIAAVVFIAYQQLENEVLQPLVQRRTIQMNPLLIAIVMLVGTSYAGILGALLALPVAGAAQVVLRDVLERRKRAWGEKKDESDDDRGAPELPDLENATPRSAVASQ
jgi:putative heme transporter